MSDNQSQADVYASFGANSAVMSGSSIEEHEQNMLSLPVDVRDGDDSIVLQSDDQEERQELELNELNEEGQEVDEEGAEEGADSDEFTPLGDPDADLVEASEAVDEYADGFQQMRAQAIKGGLPVEICLLYTSPSPRDS